MILEGREKTVQTQSKSPGRELPAEATICDLGAVRLPETDRKCYRLDPGIVPRLLPTLDPPGINTKYLYESY